MDKEYRVRSYCLLVERVLAKKRGRRANLAEESRKARIALVI